MSAHPFALMQCSGLVALTLALLVLMWTRWGHAKPLSKCIALSVFAHVLLVFYAHGTKLILAVPAGSPEPSIRVAMFGEETAEQATDREARSIDEPWDLATTPDLVIAESAELPPQLTAGELESSLASIRDEVAAGIDSAVEPLPNQPAPIAARIPAPPLVTPADQPEALEAESPAPVDPDPTASEVAHDAPLPSVPSEPTPVDRANETLADQLVESLTAPDSEFAESLPIGGGEEGAADESTVPGSEVAEAMERFTSVVEAGSNLPARDAEGVNPPQSPPAHDPRIEAAPAVPRRAADGGPLPELFELRRNDRPASLHRFGGSAETEAAVHRGLGWLAGNQNSDGHWDAARYGSGQETRVLGHDRRGAGGSADSGVTGLALLAMQGAGNSHYEGPYRLNVQRGLEYLLGIQRDDGSLAGEASLFARMYCHGIATLALSEAAALTGDDRLQPYVERAISYTVRSQHPVTGGWRYQPGDRGDMSQFGWQVMALKSADLAGIRISAETRGRMLRFLRDNTSGEFGGLASYRAGERVSSVMTAEALVCRMFLGAPHDSALVKEASNRILADLPDRGIPNLYYWYYGTLAMFQVQGDAWQHWNRVLQDQLPARQRVEGNLAGSWDPDTVWGGYGGRVYSTAMATLCLEIYYRYLPIYEVSR